MTPLFLLVSLLISSLAAPLGHAQSMTTAGQFAVSPSGAATYNIPVQIPPGIAGMEPRLSLNYNSQGGSGLLGMGWSLGGLSSITRCAQTQSQDGKRGAINLDVNDRFCMDGQRLMLTAGSYGTANSEYRTETESFSKVIYSGANFTVQSKAGLTMLFVPVLTKTAVLTWGLSKITDVAGNYLAVSYNIDSTNNQFQPNRIDYTGNSSQQPTNSVQFTYDSTRLDVVPMYLAGVQMKSTQRLSKVATYVGSNKIKEYRLTYAAQTNKADTSKIAAIAECDSAGVCLPPTTFTAQSGGMNGNFVAQNTINFGTDVNSWELAYWSYGDFNGDGKLDIIQHTNTDNTKRVWLSNGDGSFAAQTPFNFGTNINSWATTYWSYADFNGDGKLDIIQHTNTANTKRVWLSNGDGSFAAQTPFNFGADVNSWDAIYWTYGDFNGDGKADIIQHTNTANTKRVWLSNGDGSFAAQAAFNFGTDVYSWEPSYWSYGDFNGDGKLDIIQHTKTGYTKKVWLSSGDGSFTAKTAFNFGADVYSWDPAYWSYGDFNGDGKLDIIQHTNTGYTKRVWLSNGDGSFTGQAAFNFGADVNSWASNFWSYGDFNGDGKLDIIQHTNTAYTKRIWLSNGDGSFAAQTAFNFGSDVYSWEPGYWSYGDFNGDGKLDIIQHTNTAYTKKVWLAATPNQQSDLVTSITNANGFVTSLAHKPLADNATYTKDTGTNKAIYPQIDLQPPMYVVASVQTSNGVGGANTIQYTYGGLKAEMGTGRGMLGFRWINAKEQATGIESYSEYRQNWPYTGMATKSETRLSGAGNAGLLKQTTANHACKAPATGLACTIQAGSRYFPYTVSTQESSWDLGGAAYPSTTTLFDYQANSSDGGAIYGDPTTITVTNSDGATKTTVNEYLPANISSDNWILGRLQKATVTSAQP